MPLLRHPKSNASIGFYSRSLLFRAWVFLELCFLMTVVKPVTGGCPSVYTMLSSGNASSEVLENVHLSLLFREFAAKRNGTPEIILPEGMRRLLQLLGLREDLEYPSAPHHRMYHGQFGQASRLPVNSNAGVSDRRGMEGYPENGVIGEHQHIDVISDERRFGDRRSKKLYPEAGSLRDNRRMETYPSVNGKPSDGRKSELQPEGRESRERRLMGSYPENQEFGNQKQMFKYPEGQISNEHRQLEKYLDNVGPMAKYPIDRESGEKWPSKQFPEEMKTVDNSQIDSYPRDLSVVDLKEVNQFMANGKVRENERKRERRLRQRRPPLSGEADRRGGKMKAGASGNMMVDDEHRHDHHYDDDYDHDHGWDEDVFDPVAECGTVSYALQHLALQQEQNITAGQLWAVCPSLLHYLLLAVPSRCIDYRLQQSAAFSVQPVHDRMASGDDPNPRPYRIDPNTRDVIPRYDPSQGVVSVRPDKQDVRHHPYSGTGVTFDRPFRKRRPYFKNRAYLNDPRNRWEDDDDYYYDYYDPEYRWRRRESVYARWLGGVVSMLLIGVISVSCTMLLPALKKTRHYDQANHFLLSLAVGTLAGDALIHLLPHAISMGEESEFARSDHDDHYLHLHEHDSSMHFRQALYGFTALMGVIIFLFLERLHNVRSGSRHSHSRHGGSVSNTLNRSTLAARNSNSLLSDSAIDVIGLPPSQQIGKKLSEHTKDDSFHNTTETDLDDRCFGSCPPQNRPTEPVCHNEVPVHVPEQNFSNCVPRSATLPRGVAPALPPRAPVGATMPRGMTVGGGHVTGGTASTNPTLRRDQVLPVRRQPLKDASAGGVTRGADPAEWERLVSPLSVAEKLADQDKSTVVLPRNERDDGGSVHMILQEYHVSHHGHSHHGHAHVSGRKDSLRMMILMGESMHIFMDGMAIGAAFATSLTGGIATAIAVLCHELPHKLGDFALLFDMGMTRRTALQMVAGMWLLSVVGMIIGELVGSIESAAPWIYSFTGGVFIYLALVDLLSEVSVKGGESCSAAGQILLQMCGMLVGSAIMLLIALYEHDLHIMLARVFY